MAFSSFNRFVPSADSSFLTLQYDTPSSSSPARGPALLRNPQSRPTGPIPAPAPAPAPINSFHSFKSNQDHLSEPLTSRSSKSMVVCSFAIAATTAIGLSICSLDCVAIAAELETNNRAILSVASVHTSPNLKPASGQNPSFTLVFNPSMSFNADPDISFSMAIPIPHEEVWIRVQNGFVAPVPRTREHGLVMPFSQSRKTTVAPAGSTSKCPQWTPSEFEMVLPDFHGRPKPFPHQGHHWSASYVMRGMHGEAFLQLSASNGEGELDGMDGKTTMAMEDNINEKQREGKPPLLKGLGMEKSSCFSM